jgi:hypothetical protein
MNDPRIEELQNAVTALEKKLDHAIRFQEADFRAKVLETLVDYRLLDEKMYPTWQLDKFAEPKVTTRDTELQQK